MNIRKRIRELTWAYCRHCRGAMAWRRYSESRAFDRVTGEPTESFWEVYACPSWAYVGGNPHDFHWGAYVQDQPVSVARPTRQEASA